MSWFEIFVVWFAGVMNGFIFTSLLVMHIGKKALKGGALDTASPKKPVITDEEIRRRINRVKEITDIQLDMQSANEGPQKNSMDGKSKNGINAQIKALEQEKVSILQSIITDGFDPIIAVAHPDGTIENVALSRFMTGLNIDTPKPKTHADKVDERRKNLSKFTVYTGGKPDGGNTTH